jgi:hypothetical protein
VPLRGPLLTPRRLTTRLRDGAALFGCCLQFVFVYVVVVGAIMFTGLDGLTECAGERNGPAEVRPVRTPKYIIIGKLSEDNDPLVIPSLKVFVEFRSENYRFSFAIDKLLAMLQNSVASGRGSHRLIREDQSPFNFVDGVARMLLVYKLWQVIFLEQPYGYVAIHCQGGSFPGVHEGEWDHDLLAHNQAWSATNEWHDPPTLLQVKSFRLGVSTVPRRSRSIRGSLGGLLKLRVLLDNLSELTAHHGKLAIVDARNCTSDQHGGCFQNNFPKWGLIGLAMMSFSLTLYGWWHLRNKIRIALGLCCWRIGIALWAYTVNVWIIHCGDPMKQPEYIEGLEAPETLLNALRKRFYRPQNLR